jgi:hypothetical protein
MTTQPQILSKVRTLLQAYKNAKFGDQQMPEDTHPQFPNLEMKRIYYTLPMALNYQRDSYKLWEAAKKTFEDNETRVVFNLGQAADLEINTLKKYLLKYKLALQPNRHIDIWSRIVSTLYSNWGDLASLVDHCGSDYCKIREIMQEDFKKGFPYISGPQIFNYWMYIVSEYGEVDLKNRSYIGIAPDIHVIQASIRLGVIDAKEAESLSRERISEIWRSLLKGSGIDPIDVHSPLWFWSRGGFELEV